MRHRRPHRRASCEGKRRYDVEGAWAATRRLSKGGALVHPYRCPWCASWHVGHLFPR